MKGKAVLYRYNDAFGEISKEFGRIMYCQENGDDSFLFVYDGTGSGFYDNWARIGEVFYHYNRDTYLCLLEDNDELAVQKFLDHYNYRLLEAREEVSISEMAMDSIQKWNKEREDNLWSV